MNQSTHARDDEDPADLSARDLSARDLSARDLSARDLSAREMMDDYIDELRNDHLGLVGGSKAMVALRDLIRRVAHSDRPVLILGPVGSGKFLVAEAIHRVSNPDSGNRLSRISCSEIGEQGIEQVLFGAGRQLGLLGQPGAVVLEDVDALSLPLQEKLLRVLQTGAFRSHGAAEEQPVAVRVIATTARSLARCVREQTFRAELLFEIGVLTVPVPGLDERRDDIPALVNHFLRLGPRHVRFSGEALDLMATRAWPGSVRELRNLVERVAAFTREPLIGGEALRGLLQSPLEREHAAAMSLKLITSRLLDLPVNNKLAAVEAALLEGAMRATEGNKSAAARLLGVHRKAVERKLEKYRVRTPEAAKGKGNGNGDGDNDNAAGKPEPVHSTDSREPAPPGRTARPPSPEGLHLTS